MLKMVCLLCLIVLGMAQVDNFVPIDVDSAELTAPMSYPVPVPIATPTPYPFYNNPFVGRAMYGMPGVATGYGGYRGGYAGDYNNIGNVGSFGVGYGGVGGVGGGGAAVGLGYAGFPGLRGRFRRRGGFGRRNAVIAVPAMYPQIVY